MANRPVYIPSYDSELFVITQYVEFTWHAGMAPSQKKKSVVELHESAKKKGICKHPLEISSKSIIELGVQLSAFNLAVKTERRGNIFTVETAYQSSKKFQNGGPYKELLYGTSLAAKKDIRLKESGDLVAFEFFGDRWPLEPKTVFYDWIYLNSLRKNKKAIAQLVNYDAFTDIEFNPKKSINCQAYSVALFKSLDGRGLLNNALESKDAFIDLMSEGPVNNAAENTSIQPRLI